MKAVIVIGLRTASMNFTPSCFIRAALRVLTVAKTVCNARACTVVAAGEGYGTLILRTFEEERVWPVKGGLRKARRENQFDTAELRLRPPGREPDSGLLKSMKFC